MTTLQQGIAIRCQVNLLRSLYDFHCFERWSTTSGFCKSKMYLWDQVAQFVQWMWLSRLAHCFGKGNGIKMDQQCSSHSVLHAAADKGTNPTFMVAKHQQWHTLHCDHCCIPEHSKGYLITIHCRECQQWSIFIRIYSIIKSYGIKAAATLQQTHDALDRASQRYSRH